MKSPRGFGLLAVLVLLALSSLAGCTIEESITPKPTISPGGGNYASPQAVTLADSESTASIFYTTDGSSPGISANGSTKQYTSPIVVSTSLTLQALAVASGAVPSEVVSATYTYTGPPAAPPTFSPPAGSYPTAQTVSLADTTPNATIYYTTDGSTPTTASTPFFLPFPVVGTTTVLAMATAPTYSQSPVASATYTIAVPPTDHGMWTWMGGSQVANQLPVYGTLGVPDPANTPGYNSQGIVFPGPNGTFLLFAGEDNGSSDSRNALWQYDPATGLWTWVAGPSTADSNGNMERRELPPSPTCPLIAMPGPHGRTHRATSTSLVAGKMSTLRSHHPWGSTTFGL